MPGTKRRRLDDDGSAANLLDEIFQNFVIFDTICSHLDISGINTLRKVTKRWSSLLSIHLKSRWDLNQKLRRFVTSPEDLRSQLGEHNALISGSFAIQFFDGVVWRESDLDIFVEHNKGASELGQYLINCEGYEFVSVKDIEEYTMTDLMKTETYQRTFRDGSHETHSKIQIVSTQQLPVQAILRGFYTTAVVNIITWNKAYAIFPDCTFLERKTYMLKPLDDFFGAQLVKYSGRGWTTLETQWEEDKRPRHSLQNLAERRVGDSKMWTIALDTKGVRKPVIPDSVIEYACFGIVKTRLQHNGSNQEDRDYYTINAAIFESCVLRYEYTYSSGGHFWLFHIGGRLDNLTKIEIMKLPPDDRPAAFRPPQGDVIYHHHNQDIRKPSTWVYYDSYIPEWYKYWEDNIKKARE